MESKVIVINHGSNSLKIGLASDLVPKIIPNFIARRKNPIKLNSNINNNINGNSKSNKSIPDKRIIDSQIEIIKNSIKDYQIKYSSGNSNKIKIPTNNIIYNELNCISNEKKRKKKEITGGITNTTSIAIGMESLNFNDINYCIGEDAIQVSKDTENWDCYSPISLGTFNVTKEHSLRNLCDELVEMWKYAIQRYLGIASQDLSIYGCVYVVPDFFETREIKETLSMILRDLPFTSALLYQESVCATFGASMSNQCCLIDIGHDKIQIACIDEGYLIPQSRITLKYGSNTQRKLLQYLLMNSSPESSVQKYYFPRNVFPPPQAESSDLPPYYIKAAFESLKNEHLNFQFDNMKQAKVSQFKLDDPKNERQLNVFRFNTDELYQIVAMSLFYPQLLLEFTSASITPPLSLQKQQEITLDYEQILDDSVMNLNPQDVLNSTNGFPSHFIDYSKPALNDRYSTLPLDVAVYRCIMNQLNERIDTKKKFFNNILVVGGGSQIPEFQEILKHRLQNVIENTVALPTSTTTTVLLSSDAGYYQNIRTDIDVIQMPWKGGAIIGCLESSKEIWITRNDYKNGENSTILREKLPF